MRFRALLMSVLVVVVACRLILAQAARPPAQRLAPRELKTIDRIAHAYYESKTKPVLEMLSRLVGRMGDAKIEALNQELARRKMPHAAKVLTEARLTYVQQGLTKQLPKPGPRETLIVLQTLNERVSRTLEARADLSIMADPIAFPSTPDGWHETLWKLHVLENQLETARLMADYMTRLAKGHPAGGASRLNESDRQLVQSDHSQLVERVQQATLDVEEREIELRTARLKAAIDRLEDPALDAARFLAAYTAAVDSRIVAHYFERAKKSELRIQNKTLSDDSTIESSLALAKRAQELDPELSYKAALLYEGLHWWLRGRYGMGPDVAGLAKSGEALHSLSAQLGLYMPSETPRPTSPADLSVKKSVPTFDRRHHYWWAWEDRRLHRGTLSTSTKVIQGENFLVTLSSFW
jgi:hypothetical protein